MAASSDAVLYALTGELHPLTAGGIAERLTASGWTIERVVALRDERREAWPHPVPRELLEHGYAAFAGSLAQALSDLGLTTRHLPPPPARALNADERRLQADRPPHWA